MFSAIPQPADETAKIGSSDDEHQAAPKHIAQRTADENQGAQEQSIRLDHPLHIDNRCLEAGLKRWQRDIHGCAVDECHAGTKDGCG